jgi:hypothetical protein
MRSIGSTLLFFSIGTFVLDFFGYEFIIMTWIYNWGMGVGLGILGTMFVVGGVLFFLGGSTSEAAAD